MAYSTRISNPILSYTLLRDKAYRDMGRGEASQAFNMNLGIINAASFIRPSIMLPISTTILQSHREGGRGISGPKTLDLADLGLATYIYIYIYICTYKHIYTYMI